MDTQFWLQRWQEGRIGWHHNEPMPLLIKHWPALELADDTRVLVPLCGKSPDMVWLSQQGMRVLGIELSPLAVDAFLSENNLRARTHASAAGPRHEVINPPGAGIEIINADIFAIGPDLFSGCDALYDRAALIALPKAARERLVAEVYAKLPATARGLVITLDYPTNEMEGPPFAVDDNEMRRLFNATWTMSRVEHRDILAAESSFSEKGVTSLHTSVYTLRHSG